MISVPTGAVLSAGLILLVHQACLIIVTAMGAVLFDSFHSFSPVGIGVLLRSNDDLLKKSAVTVTSMFSCTTRAKKSWDMDQRFAAEGLTPDGATRGRMSPYLTCGFWISVGTYLVAIFVALALATLDMFLYGWQRERWPKKVPLRLR